MISGKESGVVIWYILIAIVLFAALSFSFVRSSENTQSTANKEQAKVTANEILRYSKSLKLAVQQLISVHGCAENDVSFYSDKWAIPGDYDNANTPVAGGDFNCFIFNSQGAGINWKGAFELGYLPEITADCDVDGVGTTGADIVMVMNNVSLEICREINKLSGVSMTGNMPDTQPSSCNYNSNAQGAFASVGTLAGATGEETACLVGSGGMQPSGQYYIYSTIYAR